MKVEYGWCGNPRHTHKEHVRQDTCFAFYKDEVLTTTPALRG